MQYRLYDPKTKKPLDSDDGGWQSVKDINGYGAVIKINKARLDAADPKAAYAITLRYAKGGGEYFTGNTDYKDKSVKKSLKVNGRMFR